jgi:hypothetical protein
MIFGNTEIFAIDTEVCEEWHHSGIGWFTLIIRGLRYGVLERDASALGCSFDAISDRLSMRGGHVFSFANLEAAQIADALRLAIYAPDGDARYDMPVPKEDFAAAVHESRIEWAPDGDEAFDDGSFVLQIDLGEMVRIIGFRSATDDYLHDPATLREVTLEADTFYRILQLCSEWFTSKDFGKGRNA